jgi:hypothetical protein
MAVVNSTRFEMVAGARAVIGVVSEEQEDNR